MADLTLREIIGLGGIAFGLFFYTFGVYGFIRFRDVYVRIHSAGMVSALGIFGFVFAAMMLAPGLTFKVLVLGFLMFIVQPVASHSIAQAAYRSGVKMFEPVRDDLKGNIEMHDELAREEEKRQTQDAEEISL